MDHPRILLQLDTDPQASVFDAVVAIDSQVDQLLQYASVAPDDVERLVHGLMFTRGPADLRHSAIFVGGADVTAGSAVAERIKQTFFGPIRVSVMLDGNGSNTTAAAAVLCAARHVDLAHSQALVLGGTGPVGQRVARLLLSQGGQVRLASRQAARAAEVCHSLAVKRSNMTGEQLQPVATADRAAFEQCLESCNLIFSCGAAGVTLLDEQQLALATHAKVAIDLNAVPPAGIAGIAVTDKAVNRTGRVDYGAIGVGGLKMKIHREAIATLFTRNDLFLDAEEIFAIGKNIEAATTV